MDKYTEKELEEMLKEKRKQKRRMKTGKKALLSYFIACSILVIFTMLMIYLERDSSALNTLAEVGLKGLPVVYGVYQANSYFINKKHMEQNYNPNYDEENNLY